MLFPSLDTVPPPHVGAHSQSRFPEAGSKPRAWGCGRATGNINNEPRFLRHPRVRAEGREGAPWTSAASSQHPYPSPASTHDHPGLYNPFFIPYPSDYLVPHLRPSPSWLDQGSSSSGPVPTTWVSVAISFCTLIPVPPGQSEGICGLCSTDLGDDEMKEEMFMASWRPSICGRSVGHLPQWSFHTPYNVFVNKI